MPLRLLLESSSSARSSGLIISVFAALSYFLLNCVHWTISSLTFFTMRPKFKNFHNFFTSYVVFLKKLVHGSSPRFFIGDLCLPISHRYIAFRFFWFHYNLRHAICQYPFLLFHNVKFFKNLLTRLDFRVIFNALGLYKTFLYIL